MSESDKHKKGKKIAAEILDGKTECNIRKGHRADACNDTYYAEVDCKKTEDGRKCEINIYPNSCEKVKGKVKCDPILTLEY